MEYGTSRESRKVHYVEWGVVEYEKMTWWLLPRKKSMPDQARVSAEARTVISAMLHWLLFRVSL